MLQSATYYSTKSLQQKYRMLVVEPEEALAQILTKHLEHCGFRVFMARTESEGLMLLEQRGLPHLAIVDVKMALQPEFTFCKQIKQFTDLPVVMLVEQHDVPNLEMTGCSSVDFLSIRPLKTLELLAHVQRILQKVGNFAYLLDNYIEIDQRLSVNLATRQAIVNHQVVHLTPIENKILHILIRDAGQIVTTRVLLNKLALTSESYENGLTSHLASLRHKLEINPLDPQYFLSQAGIGYCFALMSRQ
jgi:DNA-binding response OmpR family regulator